jgi:SM-20-related protein
VTIQADTAPLPLPGHPGAARCPHLVFKDVLGAESAAAMLDYVASRQDDFWSATVRTRKTGKSFIDRNVRDCLSFKDLGVFEAPIRDFVGRITPLALDTFGMNEPNVELRQLSFLAYGDGGYFRRHIDTSERLDRVRLLSYVYYFARVPQRFRGGELRLYSLPRRLGDNAAPSAAPFVDVPPDTDTLLVFPSWLRHEVLPVEVPSGDWIDSRFAIACWLHRATPADARLSDQGS